MKTFIALAIVVGLVGAKVIGGYDSPVDDYGATDDYAAGDDYGSDYKTSDYQSNDYKAPEYETKCTPYYDTETHDRCEQYTEKVCYTTQQESCQDVEDKNCRGIVSGRQFRKCFNVTELLCGLREEIRYDVVQAVFTVQKCHKVTERVCDTVYQPQFTNKDDYQCISIRNPQCHSEDRTVYDKTCRTVTSFKCPTYAGNDYEGGEYGSAGYGADTGYGADAGYGESYGDEKCKRSYDTKCYTTPRKVSSSICEHREDKVCEKLNEKVPIPAEKQVCHDEEKKVCELEQRQQPKQIKKYVYTKQCRSVPRKVCENADSKQLLPSCVPTTRKQCHYSPVERCEEIPKQHCYKVTRKVQKQKCETVQAYAAPKSDDYGTSDYGSDSYDSDSYAAPAGDSY